MKKVLVCWLEVDDCWFYKIETDDLELLKSFHGEFIGYSELEGDIHEFFSGNDFEEFRTPIVGESFDLIIVTGQPE